MADHDIALTSPHPQALPFGMTPAPTPQHTIVPVDLGRWISEYAGWLVVIDPDVSIGVYDILGVMSDESQPALQRLQAMAQYVAAVCLAWNFTRYNPATGQSEPLPQPREGGAKFFPQPLLPALSQALGEAVNPPKTSAGS